MSTKKIKKSKAAQQPRQPKYFGVSERDDCQLVGLLVPKDKAYTEMELLELAKQAVKGEIPKDPDFPFTVSFPEEEDDEQMSDLNTAKDHDFSSPVCSTSTVHEKLEQPTQRTSVKISRCAVFWELAESDVNEIFEGFQNNFEIGLEGDRPQQQAFLKDGAIIRFMGGQGPDPDCPPQTLIFEIDYYSGGEEHKQLHAALQRSIERVQQFLSRHEIGITHLEKNGSMFFLVSKHPSKRKLESLMEECLDWHHEPISEIIENDRASVGTSNITVQ